MYRREERGIWNWCKGFFLMILKILVFFCRVFILSLSMIMYKRVLLLIMFCLWLFYKIVYGLKFLNLYIYNDIYKDMNIINIYISLECLGLRKWGFFWCVFFFCLLVIIVFLIIWVFWDKDYYFLSFKEYILGFIYIYIFLLFSMNIYFGDEFIEILKIK